MSTMSSGMATSLPLYLLLLHLALYLPCRSQHISVEPRALGIRDAQDIHGLHGVQRFRQLLKLHENRHSLPGGVILARPSLPPRLSHEPLDSPDLVFIRNSSSLARRPSSRNPSHPTTSSHTTRGQGAKALEKPSHTPEAPPDHPESHTTTASSQSPHPPMLDNSMPHFESTKIQIPVTPPLRSPEPPRVPEPPPHLPVDLTNRLKRYPSLQESLDYAPTPATMHTFFEPTIKVEAEEVTDEEWGQYLEDEWGVHGISPSFLALPPPYLINVNYGDHLCVHLGTLITPAQARHPPKALQFPGEVGRHYTILLLDLDRAPRPYISWMLVNVPHSQPQKGTEVVEYEAPQPAQDSGAHRMVFLVYLQQGVIPPGSSLLPRAKTCQESGREVVDMGKMTRDLGLKGPVAGNYFLAEWDVTVEHICTPPLQ